MATALELVSSAMRLAGILGEGQIPSADQGSNALEALNDILSDWNNDSLVLYQTASNTFPTVANNGTYTIGTGGTWVMDRPGQINSAYIDFSGVSFRVEEINTDEYNLIVLKGMLGAFIPRFFLYLNTFPLGTLTMWPTPASVQNFTITCDRVLTEIALLSTTLTYPPGYRKALRAALAVELCPEYDRPVSPDLARMAITAKGNIKRANHVPVVAEYDPALIGAPGGLAAFLTGY